MYSICKQSFILRLLVMASVIAGNLTAQGLSPATPAKEYIRLGDRIVAIEVADITAPYLSGVSANPIHANDTTIVWTTDEPADSQVDYGTTVNYGSSTTLNTSLVTSHAQALSGLTANTLYHYRVKSKDAVGNLATSGDYTFTTAPDTTAPVISTVAAGSITQSGATISWTTNEPADSQVDYGTTTSYGSSTTLNTSLVTSHSQAVSGLTANTLYHYRVKSKDAGNNLATSADYTFTTARDTTPPVISSVAASSITSSTATINWSTNEPADSQVDYGTTTSYGSSTTLNATLVTSHSQALSGLAGSTLYHYRVKSKDAAGNLATSGDYSFTTLTPSYSISGHVGNGTPTGPGISGITIQVNGPSMATTDANGNYVVTNLTAGGSYTIAPASASYIFSPGGQTVTNLNSNVTGINFAAYSIPSGIWVSPNSGSGTSQEFLFWTQGMNPYPQQVEVLYSTVSGNAVNQCYLVYNPGGTMRLSNDAGTGFLLPTINNIPVSSSGHGTQLVNNTQCLFDTYDLYAYLSGNTLWFNLPFYFFRNFAGGKQLYTRLTPIGGSAQAWVQIGSWAVLNPSTADPSLTISTPISGATVSGTAVSVSGTVSDANTAISSVVIYVDGFKVGTATMAGTTFSYSWNSRSVANGQHTIKVVATDTDSPTHLKKFVDRTVNVLN